MGANTVCGGVVRGSLRRGDGQIPQPGGAAMGDDIGIDRHKTTACVTRMTAQGHRLRDRATSIPEQICAATGRDVRAIGRLVDDLHALDAAVRDALVN